MHVWVLSYMRGYLGIGENRMVLLVIVVLVRRGDQFHRRWQEETLAAWVFLLLICLDL
jgi:hypothetical protein